MQNMRGEAAKPASVGISEPSAGRVVVTGELTFATARDARQLGLLVLEGSRAERIVDRLQRRHARRQRRTCRAARLAGLGPAQVAPVSLRICRASLVAIARISEVDGLLTAAG